MPFRPQRADRSPRPHTEHRTDPRLLDPTFAPLARRNIEAALRALGLPDLAGEVPLVTCTVTRADPALDYRFDSPREGQAVMRALEALRPPREGQNAPIRRGGHTEYVSLRTAERGAIALRFYARGNKVWRDRVKSWRRECRLAKKHGVPAPDRPERDDEPGQWVRVERQWRPAKQQQIAVDEFARSFDVAGTFVSALGSWANRPAHSVAVMGTTAAHDQLLSLRRQGLLTRAKWTSLAGFVSNVAMWGRAAYEEDGAPGRRDYQRRHRELQQTGILLDELAAPEARSLDLSAFLADVVSG